jgi:hypothetical protein
METHRISIGDIKVDPLAHELATSEGTQPYLDCLIMAYRNNAAAFEAALEGVRNLPLESGMRGECFLRSSRHSRISRMSM